MLAATFWMNIQYVLLEVAVWMQHFCSVCFTATFCFTGVVPFAFAEMDAAFPKLNASPMHPKPDVIQKWFAMSAWQLGCWTLSSSRPPKGNGIWVGYRFWCFWGYNGLYNGVLICYNGLYRWMYHVSAKDLAGDLQGTKGWDLYFDLAWV